MSRKAFCPHCGRQDAPTEQDIIERHRRRDWDRETSPANEICLGGGLAIGERCRHLEPNDRCFSEAP
jgi:hypothetical protein